MTTVEAIEKEIEKLSPTELAEFRRWYTDFDADAWDAQIEADVLVWISRGKANREISEILGISLGTVNKHLEQVFEKLGVENRAAAAARAVRILNQ